MQTEAFVPFSAAFLKLPCEILHDFTGQFENHPSKHISKLKCL